MRPRRFDLAAVPRVARVGDGNGDGRALSRRRVCAPRGASGPHASGGGRLVRVLVRGPRDFSDVKAVFVALDALMREGQAAGTPIACVMEGAPMGLGLTEVWC